MDNETKDVEQKTPQSQFTSKLDELEALLEKQKELIRKGDFRNIETSAQQAGSIVEEMVQAGALAAPEVQARGEGLLKLYGELVLMVGAEKENVAQQLEHIRKGEKTLQAYRGEGGSDNEGTSA